MPTHPPIPPDCPFFGFYREESAHFTMPNEVGYNIAMDNTEAIPPDFRRLIAIVALHYWDRAFYLTDWLARHDEIITAQDAWKKWGGLE